MNTNYFIYNGEKYIVQYKNKITTIYKNINGTNELLSSEEVKKITSLLNNKYSYTYDSELLNNLVNGNPNIENKGYVLNFLTWLENIIPEGCRNNFYGNIASLQTTLNTNIDLSKAKTIESGYSTSAGYNTRSNSLTMNENSLLELWKVAQSNPNPQDFYWIEYAKTLLHELAHMASSKYDYKTKVSLCGFDTYPATKEEDKNRGLTEGFTEIIAMAGVPGTVEIASGYYIEASLINQMMHVIVREVFLKSYFSNLGTMPMQEKLNEIIDDPNMSHNLFRSIELNYNIRHTNEEQNVLGNIQSSILDYFDKKLELLLADNKVDEVSNLLTSYESMLINPEKLKIMKKDPQKYIGVTESIDKFNAIKTKYAMYLNDFLNNYSGHKVR